MNICLVGGTGMLGTVVLEHAIRAGHHVSLPNWDITTITGHHMRDCDVVINCAGIVKQRIADQPTESILQVNTVGPHHLAHIASTCKIRLIHVSTDCVFDQPGGPYDEMSIPDASDLYALSKRGGEVNTPPHLTIRTSFVGFGRVGLIHDLQRSLRVKVSNRLMWSGHTVDTIAQLLVLLAERRDISGLLHVPGTFQTRYTLARDLKARWDFPAILDRDDSYVADRRLISGNWTRWGLPGLPTFIEQLEVMKFRQVIE